MPRAWLAPDGLARRRRALEAVEKVVTVTHRPWLGLAEHVTRNKSWSQLVTIDIIRRDTLAANREIPSPLVRVRVKPPAAAARPAAELAEARQQ